MPPETTPASVTRSTDVSAPPERVFDLISDLPHMGELSPENTGGRWTGGATGPAVGATFRGTNRHGRRRWSTTSTVTRYERPQRFCFDVRVGPLPISAWEFGVEPVAGGCRVTETWTSRVGAVMRVVGPLTTGRPDRAGFTVTSIEQTLSRLRERAERDA